MKSVGIAELKARLSEHLKSVRRGRTLTVLDRETPVARTGDERAMTSGPSDDAKLDEGRRA